MSGPPKLRHVAVHAHIFKNAGTSFDKILSSCFGDTMFSFDKKSPGAVLAIAEVSQLITERPGVRCLASHQVRMPLPVADNMMLHPMFFLRDPVERVQSCFHFERDVQKLFPETVTMEDYVRGGLSNPRINAVIGLQTSTLCDNRLLSPERLKTDLTRDAIATAIANLHSVHAFGLVDYFAQSVQSIARSLQRYFPELSKAIGQGHVRENIGEHGGTKSSDKLKYVRESLSAASYTRLLDQTAPDRTLYEVAKKLFFSRYGTHALESAHSKA